MTSQLRIHEDTGHECCFSLSPSGEKLHPQFPCPKCEAHFAVDDGTPPDPYAADVATLRAAQAADPFDEELKERRLLLLAHEHIEWFAEQPAPRLTTAELAEFEPPNGYQLALDAMKETR